MIATPVQIKDIIINNPNKKLVADGQEKSKKLRMHMYGDNIGSYITTISGFEEEALKELRVKYAKSNKDLFSWLGRRIDKVFSARGGSTYYNLSDTLNELAMRLCMNVRDGYSARRWIECFWRPHFLDDPTGILFIEVGDGHAYPTYKSISTIYDYLPKGAGLEYVDLKVSQADKIKVGLKPDDIIHRFVDDAFDYYVKVIDNDIQILNDLTYPNFYGHVPAILNSDIIDPNSEGAVLSLYEEIINLADEYLLKGSIKITHDFRHGFPKYWEYVDDCPTCAGTAYLDSSKCPDCKGTGKNLMMKPSQAKALNYPTDKDTPIVAPNVAGYVEPSEIYYNIATSDLRELKSCMEYTLWGNVSMQQTSGMSANSDAGTKTATEIVGEQQTTIDRLFAISDSAEKRIKFIIDHVVSLELRQNYEGASVNLGRRYLLETPDTIWERYAEAKKDSAPQSLLDEMLIEFIETKYSGDPVSMAIQLKLLSVEPFVHYSIVQVQSLNVSPDDYKAKVYFGEWLTMINDAEILSKDVKELKASLQEYVAAKELPVEIPPNPIGFGK